MPRKSAIKGLPEAIRKELDRLILADKLTIDELRGFIATAIDAGRSPSRSAVGDYAKRIRDEAKETAFALRQSREMARGIAQELGPESVEGEQGRLLVEMLRTFLFRFLRAQVNDPEAAFDPTAFVKMTRSLRDMAQAMNLEADFAKRIREEAAAKMEAAAKTALAENTGQPLTPEAILARIKAIYRGEA